MIIHKVVITKQQLSLFPEKERVLLIQIGHLANELTTLTKLLIYAHTDSSIDVVRKAYTMQASVIARICIGKVFEGWRLLEAAGGRWRPARHQRSTRASTQLHRSGT